MAEPERKRRRQRRQGPAADEPMEPAEPPGPGRPGRPAEPAAQGIPAAQVPPVLSAETTPVRDPDVTTPAVPRPPAEERETERGLRGLVGSGSSQVSPGAALRARDASRPTDADTAAAERDLVIVRRNWVPRESLPGRP